LFEQPRLLAEPRRVMLAQREIHYLLKRSPTRRRAVLTVDENGLTVSVPWRTSERYIARFLTQSAQWVLRKLDAWETRKPAQRVWRSGEWLDYLGRQLQLQVLPAPYALTTLQDDNILQVALEDPTLLEAVRASVVKWYRRHAILYFGDRVGHYSAALGVAAPQVFISSARTRWGSCNAKGEVRLNWRLMQAAPPVIDYVVVHELAHLKELNHSARFWRLVERIYPQFRQCQIELTAMTQHYMTL
jgi:predicted metal-dependent hydrolase